MRAILIVVLLLFGAFAGMAQTLNSTFQFTASGFIGIPATVSTPFQGSVFNDASITVTATAFTGNSEATCCSGSYLINDSASVSITGIGTFQILVPTCLFSIPDIDPIQGVTSVDIGLWTDCSNANGYYYFALIYPTSRAWNLNTSLGPYQFGIGLTQQLATSGGTFFFYFSLTGIAAAFQAALTPGVPCAANQNGATNIEDVQGIINEALGATLATTDLNGDGVVNIPDVRIVINAVLACGITTSGITPAGFSTRIPTLRERP